MISAIEGIEAHQCNHFAEGFSVSLWPESVAIVWLCRTWLMGMCIRVKNMYVLYSMHSACACAAGVMCVCVCVWTIVNYFSNWFTPSWGVFLHFTVDVELCCIVTIKPICRTTPYQFYNFSWASFCSAAVCRVVSVRLCVYENLMVGMCADKVYIRT